MPRKWGHNARPDDIAAHARSEWDDDVLECRMERRHDFKPLDATISQAAGTFTRSRRCVRCGVEEELVRSLRTGEKLSRKISYKTAKDGYLLPAGTGRMTTDGTNQVWLEYFARVTPKPARRRRKRAA